MTNWYISLPGDPAWWQAVAGLLQAGFAVAIFVVTRRYVALTHDLVRLQADVVKLQKDTERRELYDRRIEVYEKCMAFLSSFLRDMKFEFEDIVAFLRDTRRAEFIFDADVKALLDQIYAKANDHRSLSRVPELRRTREQNDRINQAEQWLVVTAFEEAKQIFGRYLRLVEPPAPQAAANPE